MQTNHKKRTQNRVFQQSATPKRSICLVLSLCLSQNPPKAYKSKVCKQIHNCWFTPDKPPKRQHIHKFRTWGRSALWDFNTVCALKPMGGPAWICPNMLKYAQTCPNMRKYAQIRLNMGRYASILRKYAWQWSKMHQTRVSAGTLSQ